VEGAVSQSRFSLERAVEATLTLGVALSGALLLYGLARSSERALLAGILLLLFTPVARVLLVTVGLLRQRDLLFGSISGFVLLVLLSSAWMAFRP
jgi:uncharacterized membrane protein